MALSEEGGGVTRNGYSKGKWVRNDEYGLSYFVSLLQFFPKYVSQDETVLVCVL